MTVYLRRGRFLLAAELHAPFTWPDWVTRRATSYLVGFPDPDANGRARRYAAAKGWVIIE
jgi:hypothetical protein